MIYTILLTTSNNVSEELSEIMNTCGKLFDTNKKMRQHMSCYHDETIVQCDECQKLCKGKKAFREHKKSHQSVTCKECGDLVKKYSYPSHKNKCLGISPTKKMSS